MHLSKIALAIAFCSVGYANANAYNAQSSAMGFTGVAGSFKNSANNPALLRSRDASGVYFSANVGIIGSDSENLIDSLDDIDILIDHLDYHPGDEAAQRELISKLQDMDGETVRLNEGVGLMLAKSFEDFGLALHVSQSGRAGVGLLYDPNDAALIGPGFDVDDLNSMAGVQGYSVADLGVSIAADANISGFDFSYGVTAKYQRVDLFDYVSTIADFDEDDFDANENTETKSFANIDIGFYKAWDENLSTGLVGRNLVGHKLNSANGQEFKIDPELTFGAAYQLSYMTVMADIDLISHGSFAQLDDNQFASIGLEFNAGRHAQLRAGYRADIKGSEDNIVTAGVGISPWDVLALDLGGYIGQNSTYGAALQLGFKFN